MLICRFELAFALIRKDYTLTLGLSVDENQNVTENLNLCSICSTPGWVLEMISNLQ